MNLPLRLVIPGVVLAALLVVWPSLASLADLWRDIKDYEHGALIALIALAWLGLVVRDGLPGPARVSPLGCLLLAGALLAWLVAFNANSLIAHQLLAPAVLWLALYAATGWRVAVLLAGPVGFLYFATPVWDYFVPVLQQLSVLATESLLALVGVPAVVREYTVSIPEGTFRIVEGCSGKRYFMVTLAMSVLAGTVNGLRGWRFPAFVVASALLAMLANYLRIVAVIYAGHVSNMQHYLVAVEHKTLGHVIFAVLLVAVFLLARWLAPATAPAAGQSGGAAAPGADHGRSAGVQSPWPLLAPLVLLLVTFALVQTRAAATLEAPVLGPLPLVAAGWQGPLPAKSGWMPRYVAVADERRAAYSSAGGTVELYVNVYGRQRQGEELIYYGNSLLAPGVWTRGWPRVSTRLVPTSAPVLLGFEAQAADGRRWFIAHAFDVGGRLTTSELVAQLLYGLRSITGSVPAGVFAMAALCNTNCEAAQALVESFWDDMSGTVRALRQDGHQEAGPNG